MNSRNSFSSNRQSVQSLNSGMEEDVEPDHDNISVPPTVAEQQNWLRMRRLVKEQDRNANRASLANRTNEDKIKKLSYFVYFVSVISFLVFLILIFPRRLNNFDESL